MTPKFINNPCMGLPTSEEIQIAVRSTDPYILLDGKRYPIEHDGDIDNDGRAYETCNWAGDTPTCPSCHESIEDYSGQAPYESDAYSYERIECECGARFEVQHD